MAIKSFQYIYFLAHPKENCFHKRKRIPKNLQLQKVPAKSRHVFLSTHSICITFVNTAALLYLSITTSRFLVGNVLDKGGAGYAPAVKTFCHFVQCYGFSCSSYIQSYRTRATYWSFQMAGKRWQMKTRFFTALQFKNVWLAKNFWNLL